MRTTTFLALLCLGFAACSGHQDDPAQEAKPAVDFIITGSHVLTMDEELNLYAPGFVAIKGDDITAVGPISEASEIEAATTLDAGDGLILPGLVNGHQHAAMSLLRGIADDLALMTWLQDYIFPAEKELVDGDFVYWGTLLSAMEMISSGTTTYADMYYFEDRVAEATIQAGMRGVLGQTIIGFTAPDFPDPDQTLEFTRSFIEEWQDHPLITPAVAPHSPYTCSLEILQECGRLARETGAPLLIHLAETKDEVQQVQRQTGRRPVEYLADIGLLSDQTVAAHCVWVEPWEIELLKEAGTGVVHNPESNMKLASGVAPVPEMLARGLKVGLGTDGPAANNNLDMFEEMNFLAKLHKVHSLDPTLVTATEALNMATRGGAEALGMSSEIGSLEVGKRADLVVLSRESPASWPLFDAYSLAVYALSGSAVRLSMINGKIVFQEGNFSGLEPDRIRERVNRYRQQVESIFTRFSQERPASTRD